MEEIQNVTKAEVKKLSKNFPVKPYRNNLIITVNVEEADSDLILTNGQFAETQYVMSVGSFFSETSQIKPGVRVLLDLEKMMVFREEDNNSHERVGSIKIKPIEVDGRMFALITDAYILAIDER